MMVDVLPATGMGFFKMLIGLMLKGGPVGDGSG